MLLKKQYKDHKTVLTFLGLPLAVKEKLDDFYRITFLGLFTIKRKPHDRYGYLRDLPEEAMNKEMEKLAPHNPQTLGEKIKWLGIHDATPLKAQLTDKHLVRAWVTEKIGAQYLIPLLGVWDKAADIAFEALPQRFVLKCNHGCGWNIIVKDKSALDLTETRNKLNGWRQMNYAFTSLEMQYRHIQPKIVAEEYIESSRGGLPEYKIFCFGGRPAFILFMDNARYGEHRQTPFDISWNPLTFEVTCPHIAETPPAPANLAEMARCATALSAGFAFVRVDFYAFDGKLYFSEMTFTSGGGNSKFRPERYNRKFGDMLNLPPSSLHS